MKIEKKLIKRIIANNKSKAILNNAKKENNGDSIFDLWGEDNKDNKDNNKSKDNMNNIVNSVDNKDNIDNISNTENPLNYPSVPLPHPGQSYNPDRRDLNQLLKSVVESNRHLAKEEDSEKSENLQQDFASEEESEVEKAPGNLRLSNNAAVSDSNRLTKRERRAKERKKRNKLKNKEEIEKKKMKVQINSVLGMKKIAKIQQKNEDLREENRKKEELMARIVRNNIKKGIVKDKELLEDFQINQGAVSLRKIKEEINPLSERWNNILKRNIIGKYEDNNRVDKSNRKLHQFKFHDKNSTDFGFEVSGGLNIVE